VLALFLAFASAGGKGAQTEAISENVESADLWAFYQAKAIRATTLLTAAEMLETEIAAESNPAAKTAKEERIKTWKLTAARYESEPETHEGRKELAERAKLAEERREHRWQNIITTRLPQRHWRSVSYLHQRQLLPAWLSLLGSRADLALSGWDL
jgi:hypothetical protein